MWIEKTPYYLSPVIKNVFKKLNLFPDAGGTGLSQLLERSLLRQINNGRALKINF